MKISKLILLVSFVVATSVLLCSFKLFMSEETLMDIKIYQYSKEVGDNKPVSFDMYEQLEKYSEEYCIPKHILYNVAFLETTYRGPFDFEYRPNRVSPVGAVGPMQIMPSTANFINGKKVPVKKLKNDLETNIVISVKLLRRLHDQYKDWAKVCGCYNTGKPIINSYAIFCVNNEDYRKNWVSI